jgi:hypothetical protein
MTLHAELVSGPIGPDTIRVPGDPAQLRTAVQGLRGLCRQVDQASHLLKQANAPDGERGRIVLALSRAAQRTGRSLDADSQQLEALADAIDHAADVLSSSIDGADDVKRRWKQARDTLRESVHGRKNAPPDLEALIHGIDSEVAESHLTQLKRQAGMTFLDGGGGRPREHAMLLEEGSPVDQAITAYRHAARGLVDEYADLVQKAKTADNPVDEKLPRHANVGISEVDNGNDDGPDHHNVSGPAAVRTIGDQLQEGARVLDQAENRLEDIRLAIRAGRMQPDDERVGSNDGFKRDWTDHFDKIRHTLNALRRAGDTAADRLRDADENGAADVRQALREDD